jgi:hypothetical protein
VFSRLNDNGDSALPFSTTVKTHGSSRVDATSTGSPHPTVNVDFNQEHILRG